MTRSAAKAAAARHPAVDDFATLGYHLYPKPLDPAATGRLLDKVRAVRAFDSGLFLSQDEFDANPTYRGVNPIPGRNMLERFNADLAFVEQDAQIVDALSAVLGADYQILNKKLVCGVPASLIPDWLKARILGNPVNNLGAYVRPEYRDITYFFGIDFHQDLIDFPDRPADMVTLYVYLHPVTRQDAPLYLLQGSQALGATVFPHDLAKSGPAQWRYQAPGRGAVKCPELVLTGGAGFAAMWHGCTLHGTQPDTADHERISLRYLLTPSGKSRCGLDEINAAMPWPLILNTTRADLDASGRAQIKFNAVNQA